MNDEERIAYLAGEPGGETGPDERAELDDLRALLADPTVWAEPSPALADRVVAAVTEASGGAATTPRGSRPAPSRPAPSSRAYRWARSGGRHHCRPRPRFRRRWETACPVPGRSGGHGPKPGC